MRRLDQPGTTFVPAPVGATPGILFANVFAGEQTINPDSYKSAFLLLVEMK